MSHVVEPAAAPATRIPALRIAALPRPAPAGPLDPPVLTVRVGVTGHRELPRADEDGLSRVIDDVLQRVETAVQAVASIPATGYAPGPPCLVAVSPLADGADRVFAAAALKRGWELHVPMPFAQPEYEHDFTPDSRAKFRALRRHAKRVLELDGSRGHEELAYLRAGQTTLHQCEVLVTVWNGRAATHIGGTAQIVDEAYARGIPVVWIGSVAPHEAKILSSSPREEPEGIPLEPALSHLLTRMLLPPKVQKPHGWKEKLRHRAGGVEGRLGPRTYYAPMRARIWHLPIYRWFRAAVLLRAALPKPPEGPRPVWPDFDWADRRANHHAQAYRNAFTATYLLGALAVFCALAYGFAYQLEGGNALARHGLDLAKVWAWAELVLTLPATAIVRLGKAWVSIELVLTLLATAIVGLAWRGRWHELWLDARLLAERFRQLDILQRLGRSAPGTRATSGAAGAPTEELWVTWLFRAHARAIGMPAARFDREYLREYRAYLRQVLDAQRKYHQATHAALHCLRERLHLVGLALFVGTLVICFVHLFGAVELFGDGRKQVMEPMLILLAGALPAFAAAIAGIIGHGEFQRIARSSRETARRLEALAAGLEKLENGTSREYGQVAEKASELMLGELLAWHVLVNDRTIEVGH